jgi:hypothetical protein
MKHSYKNKKVKKSSIMSFRRRKTVKFNKNSKSNKDRQNDKDELRKTQKSKKSSKSKQNLKINTPPNTLDASSPP